MGIIQRQSVEGTIYVAIGVIIGFITNALIFPKVLTPEQIGLISILVAYSVIFSQFGSLGFNSVTTRLFTYFRDKKNKHHGYLFVAVIVSTIGFLIIIAIFFFIRPWLIEKSIEKSPLLVKYINYIIPLVFSFIFFNLFDHYYKVLFNAVKGTFYKEVLKRVFILVAIILFHYNYIRYDEFVFSYIVATVLPLLIIIFSLWKNKQIHFTPRLKLFTKEMNKSIASVAVYGLLTGTAGIFTLNIDRIMVEHFLKLGPTGIYTTAFFFGALVIIPSRVLKKISSVIIADSWKRDDTKNISIVYYKSCLNEFIFGLFVLIGIWINIHNIFKILPDEYLAGKYVILLIGLSFLFDMVAGTGSIIIGTSKNYRMQTVFQFILVSLLIITNWLFIPLLGITGAAIATLISKIIVNLIRYIYIFKKYKLQPYNYKFLIVLLIAIISLLVGKILPEFSNYIIDIIVRSSIMSGLFFMLILVFKVSGEINDQFNASIRSITNKLKR